MADLPRPILILLVVAAVLLAAFPFVGDRFYIQLDYTDDDFRDLRRRVSICWLALPDLSASGMQPSTALAATLWQF